MQNSKLVSWFVGFNTVREFESLAMTKYLLLFVFVVITGILDILAQELPYPRSLVIPGIRIDWSTHQRHAVGSDNFHLTWAHDGHQYGIWGDGGGFAGSNSVYRVSFGVARIEGDADSYRGFDRYGHKESSEHEALIRGKSWAILALKGRLYAWVHPDKAGGWGNWPDHHSESRLYMSVDLGASWHPASWSFTPDDGLCGGAILQYGKDYKGAGRYVYHYLAGHELYRDSAGNATSMMAPGNIYLLRVRGSRMMEREFWEFFAGMDRDKPVWSKEKEEKQPVFTDRNGVGTPMGISFSRELKRYLLTTEHTAPESGMMGIFEAPEPWGPWATVHYSGCHDWFGHDNSENVPANCFFWCFPVKWMDPGGKATMVFTGAGRGRNNDSFNSVRVEFLK